MSSPNPTGEIQAPQPHQPQQILAQSFSLNQTAPYVPPHVWTTDVLMDYHQKLYDQGIDNNKLLENFRIREQHLAWAGIAIVAGIIGFGGYLVVVGNALGKDIIGGTVVFLAGYVAGKGKANIK